MTSLCRSIVNYPLSTIHCSTVLLLHPLAHESELFPLLFHCLPLYSLAQRGGGGGRWDILGTDGSFAFYPGKSSGFVGIRSGLGATSPVSIGTMPSSYIAEIRQQML